MNLRFLRAFAAVAEQRSFSRAADALNVTQPAVSRAVTELERELGVPLIERLSRGAGLTEAGTSLYEHARIIFGAENAAIEQLALLRGLDAGSLRIGASTTIATYVLPRYLAEFHRAHPAVELSVASANTHDVAALLLEHALDIALVEGPTHDKRIDVDPWQEDELVVIAGATHPMASRRRVLLHDLADQLFIVRERGSGTREVAEHALKRHRFTPKRTLEVGSTEAIKRTVAAGLGLAIVSGVAAADQIVAGTLHVLPIGKFAVSRTFSILSLPGRQPSAAAVAFRKHLA